MIRSISLMLVAVFCLSLLLGCSRSGIVTPPQDGPEETGTANASLPSLSAERMAKIEAEWKQSKLCDWAKNAVFCQPDSKQDGIRYYGSYTITTPDESVTYDILYLSCDTLPVPSEITLGGYTFRSRTAFSLLIFSSRKLEALGIEMSVFSPLTMHGQPEGGDGAMRDEVRTALATAVELHNTYETRFYGSYLKKLPAQQSDSGEMQMQAAWLVHNGSLPQFSEHGLLRYYGHFDGFGIVFQETNLQALSGITIAGRKFSHNTSFVLYAFANGSFIPLEEAYENNLISAKSVWAIADAHKAAEG